MASYEHEDIDWWIWHSIYTVWLYQSSSAARRLPFREPPEVGPTAWDALPQRRYDATSMAWHNVKFSQFYVAMEESL
jgi:hypothetical protein